MIRCAKCLDPHSGPRSAAELVAAMARVSHEMLLLADEEDARILLRLQLRILTAELDGLCQSCQWQRAADEHHDAKAGARALGQAIATRQYPPTPEQIETARFGEPLGEAHVCKVLPLRRDLGVRFARRDLMDPKGGG